MDRSEDPEAELGRIEAALRRIEEGRYGICDACGTAIGAQVLLANPAAALCPGCAP
jgi:DnaK suppressor protein